MDHQRVLRAFLAPLYDSDQPLVPPRGATDELMLAVARHHRLSPALSVVRMNALSPSLQDTFRHDRLVTLGRGTVLRQNLVEIATALESASVKTVVLKGMAYEALAYPIPGTRPATDIDILVRREQRETAFKTFKSLGFAPQAAGPGFDEPDYHEISLRRDDVHVDLHFGLAPFVRGSIDYEVLWASIIPMPIAGAPTYSLSRPHAALHQALHMAIHHFDVPGIYLLDLARLSTDPPVVGPAVATARAWRCMRSWETAIALTVAFVRGFRACLRFSPVWTARTVRVIDSFAALTPLPRLEQIRRKIEHFDEPSDAARYLVVQGRRIIREKLMGLASAPASPAERLGW